MRPRSTACWAARYSLDLVRKYPLARSRIFLRLARRLVPRFTRGIAVLLFYFVWRLEVRRLLPLLGFLKPSLFTRRCGSFAPQTWLWTCPRLILPKTPVAPLHIRDHSRRFFVISVTHQGGFAQMFLALFRLGAQDVAQTGLVPLDLPRTRFLEALRSAFVCF